MMAATGVKRPRERIKIAFTQDYEETSLLGAGGFGVVVKARHRVTGEAVAIKRVRYSDDDDGRNKKQAQRELMQEAQFLDACKGLPFLVGYHGLARDLATSELCLLMEFVPGPSLHAYLTDDKKPPLPERTAGTLTYMAPEMLLGKTDYDERVDTWSLGCVMAELILRRPLFEGDDDSDEKDNDEEEVGQLAAIFDVLGVPDGRTWRGFKSLPLANEVMKKVPKQRRENRLRDMFPERTLSKEGFDVLSGLLTSNPAKRLTAAAALKMPWLNNVEAPSLMPEKNEEVATVPPPAVHKRKGIVIIKPPATPKRKRVVIIPPAMPNVLCAAA